MNTEEALKHLGNHWDLYRFVGTEERSFDSAKKFLMEECGKPESTARTKLSSFRDSQDSLIQISDDGKRFSIDKEKVEELEATIDVVIRFSDFDYRYRIIKEWDEYCTSLSEDLDNWQVRYYSISDQLKKFKEESYDKERKMIAEKKELRQKAADTIAQITERVSELTTECDTRLQKLEHGDFMAKGLPFVERVKIFFQMKFGLIPIRDYRKMEVDIYRCLDELQEMQKDFGGER